MLRSATDAKRVLVPVFDRHGVTCAVLFGLRNRIVHDYEGVNLKLVWEIIPGDLPELEKGLNKLL